LAVWERYQEVWKKPENTGNNNKSWFIQNSRTPGNSTNTKEGTAAWIEDSEKEKAVH